MKQSHTEEFNRQLYDTIRQSAQNCVIPSFHGLAQRIQRGEAVECFEQFFADDKTMAARLPRKFHGAAWVAAAAVLTVSGLLVGSLFHARAYDTSENASAAAQAMYEEETTVDNTSVNEALADEAEDMENKKAMQDAALPSSDDCTQAILSGGRALLVPLDELTEENGQRKKQSLAYDEVS